MQRGIVDKKVLAIIGVLYVLLPLIFWYFGNAFFIPVGLLIAYAIDRLTPKWVYDLSWEEIDLALKNLGPYGVTVSHLIFRIKGRKFFIYRDLKGKPYRYVLRIPIDHWQDVYDKEDIERIFKDNGGWWSPDKYKGLRCLSYFPKNNMETCKIVLQKFIKDASADLKKDVFAQVDYAKRDVWVRHDEEADKKMP